MPAGRPSLPTLSGARFICRVRATLSVSRGWPLSVFPLLWSFGHCPSFMTQHWGVRYIASLVWRLLIVPGRILRPLAKLVGYIIKKYWDAYQEKKNEAHTD
jgi:hypothetical protein